MTDKGVFDDPPPFGSNAASATSVELWAQPSPDFLNCTFP